MGAEYLVDLTQMQYTACGQLDPCLKKLLRCNGTLRSIGLI